MTPSTSTRGPALLLLCFAALPLAALAAALAPSPAAYVVAQLALYAFHLARRAKAPDRLAPHLAGGVHRDPVEHLGELENRECVVHGPVRLADGLHLCTAEVPGPART